MSSPVRRPRTALCVAAACAVSLLLSCWGVSYDVIIPEEELQRDLQRRFPLTRTYAGVAQVTLRDPLLRLGRKKDRLTASLNAVVSPRGLGLAGLGGGSVEISSGLAYRDSAGDFVLRDVAVDSIGIDIGGLEREFHLGVVDLIRTILRQELEGMPVYQLKSNEARAAIAKLFLRKISIRKDAIVVTLGF
jgi:hypothetical protein